MTPNGGKPEYKTTALELCAFSCLGHIGDDAYSNCPHLTCGGKLTTGKNTNDFCEYTCRSSLPEARQKEIDAANMDSKKKDKEEEAKMTVSRASTASFNRAFRGMAAANKKFLKVKAVAAKKKKSEIITARDAVMVNGKSKFGQKEPTTTKKQTVETSTDGHRLYTFANGNTLLILKDKREIRTYATDGAVTLENTDGSKTQCDKDGTLFDTDAAGNIVLVTIP
jgi:hypothetical protein